MKNLRLLYNFLNGLGLWNKFKQNHREYRDEWDAGPINDPEDFIVNAFPWLDESENWDDVDTKWRELLINSK